MQVRSTRAGRAGRWRWGCTCGGGTGGRGRSCAGPAPDTATTTRLPASAFDKDTPRRLRHLPRRSSRPCPPRNSPSRRILWVRFGDTLVSLDENSASHFYIHRVRDIDPFFNIGYRLFNVVTSAIFKAVARAFLALKVKHWAVVFFTQVQPSISLGSSSI